jgi:hypothetical protein
MSGLGWKECLNRISEDKKNPPDGGVWVGLMRYLIAPEEDRNQSLHVNHHGGDSGANFSDFWRISRTAILEYRIVF